MRRHPAHAVFLGSGFLGLLAASAGPVLAADVAGGAAKAGTPERPYDVVLEIGAGGSMRPAYEGSKDTEFSPTGLFTLHYLWIPYFGEVKKKSGRPSEGFSFGPSFRYLSKRDSNDHPSLRGLDEVEASFELGGRFAYTFGMFRPWAAVRYGITGHNGLVGEAGLEMVVRPTADTEVTFGPRASFASREYMQTYFGITPQESVRSGLATYAPSGGLKGVGAEVGGRYQVTPEWAVVGSLAYEKLVGDAKDSPIVQAGESNQFTAKLGVTYRFGLKLFD